MIIKRKLLSVTLFAFILSARAAQTTSGPKISVQRVIKTEAAVQFSILIENSEPFSIFLEETREGTQDPYAINIEQLQPNSTWMRVGPRRDVPAMSVFELKPGAKVEKTVTVTDPYVDLRSATHTQYPIRGQHRAAVRYFLSPKDWADFMHDSHRRPRLVFSQVTSIREESKLNH